MFILLCFARDSCSLSEVFYDQRESCSRDTGLSHREVQRVQVRHRHRDQETELRQIPAKGKKKDVWKTGRGLGRKRESFAVVLNVV